MKRYGVLVALTVTAIALTPRGSYAGINVDWMPGVSQLKSLGQAIAGDTDGARRTQQNYLKTAPVVSQLNSLGHAIAGKSGDAKKIQEDFYNAHVIDNKENVVKGMSVFGKLTGGTAGGMAAKVGTSAILNSLPRAGDSAGSDSHKPAAPPQTSGKVCWWTGCQLSTWAVVGCAHYGMSEIDRAPCDGGTLYYCCNK